MEKWIDVLAYRDFWDQPRIFFVRYEGNLILFDCAFDEDTEDYPDTYTVYRMPELTEAECQGSWAGIARRAIECLGIVPLSMVRFEGESYLASPLSALQKPGGKKSREKEGKGSKDKDKSKEAEAMQFEQGTTPQSERGA